MTWWCMIGGPLAIGWGQSVACHWWTANEPMSKKLVARQRQTTVDRQVLTVGYHPHAGGGPLAIGRQSVSGMPLMDRQTVDGSV